jgi:hypothetical protein
VPVVASGAKRTVAFAFAGGGGSEREDGGDEHDAAHDRRAR